MLKSRAFPSPIYGSMVFYNPTLIALIESWPMQRLKAISQLGARRFFRYHDRHNRFYHSLGTAYLIQYLFEQNQHFIKISPSQKLEAIIAGLLHDIGHGPFSHDFEGHFFTFLHEQQSVKLIRDPKGSIYPILNQAKLNIDRICDLILGKRQNDYAQTLISGQFDLDRLDYLLHDSYYIGLTFEKPLQWQKLLNALKIHQNHLVFDLNALQNVEHFLHCRFLYRHKFWDENHLLIYGFFQKLWLRLNDLLQAQKVTLHQLEPYAKLWNLPHLQATEFRQWTDEHLITWLTKLAEKLQDNIFTFFLTNFLRPLVQEKKLIFQRLDLLMGISKSRWQRYHRLQFTLQIATYLTDQQPIYFIGPMHQNIISLDQISPFFTKNIVHNKKSLFFIQ